MRTIANVKSAKNLLGNHRVQLYCSAWERVTQRFGLWGLWTKYGQSLDLRLLLVKKYCYARWSCKLQTDMWQLFDKHV